MRVLLSSLGKCALKHDSKRRSTGEVVAMFFREVLNEDLGCGSYVVAEGGEAAVIDPKWEIQEYLQIAEENGFRISHIIETHNHADHLSGRGRLVEATGATIHV